MGFFKKLIDFVLADSWEEYKRIQLMDKVKDNLPKKKIREFFE